MCCLLKYQRHIRSCSLVFCLNLKSLSYQPMVSLCYMSSKAEGIFRCSLSVSAFKIPPHLLPCAICSDIIKYEKLFSRFLSQPQILEMPAYGISLFHGFKRVKAAFDALSLSQPSKTQDQQLDVLSAQISSK